MQIKPLYSDRGCPAGRLFAWLYQIPPSHLRDARLGIRERIDDAAEQDRLHEHCRGERQIGEREHPAQTGLAPEQSEYADVKTKQFHGADIGKRRG